jgi:hypothetical protein
MRYITLPLLLALSLLACDNASDTAPNTTATDAASPPPTSADSPTPIPTATKKDKPAPPLPEPEYENHPDEEPSPTPPAKEAQLFKTTSNLKALSLKIAPRIENRLPVGEATSFPASVGHVLAWAEIENRDQPTKVTFVWKQDGTERSRADLDVGLSPGWRTWARKSFRSKDTGKWTVEILDDRNNLLASRTFSITAP